MRFTPTNPLNAYQTQKEFEDFKEKEREKQDLMEAIKKIADSAVVQAESAKADAKSAKKDALFSKIVSIITVIISILAIIFGVIF